MSYTCCKQYGCSCNKCYEQPLNPSNRTIVVPVAGADAYQTWLAYHPELDPANNPSSPWTEPYWLDNWVKTNLNYEQFEI